MAEQLLGIEVVHVSIDQQVLLSLQVAAGCTAREAVLCSGLQASFPALDLLHAPLGIFGKVIAVPESRVLEEGDRVEVYRPLQVDPKEMRKRRAAQAKHRTRQA
jgi:putative ubiquitin-RnfH superfamily antitoxin RatB of RatAB toxin-antitoxin module